MLKPRSTEKSISSLTRRQVCLGGLLVACTAGLNYATGAESTVPNSTFEVLVFSDPDGGRDADFNAWYDQHHNPELLEVPGFRDAARFKVALGDTPSSTLPSYLAVYTVQSVNMTAALAEVRRREHTGRITPSDAFDQSHSVTLVFRPLGPQILAADVHGSSDPPSIPGHERRKYILVVMSNPVPGREQEYNTWYDTQHLPDVLQNPGFCRGGVFS
jgi:hypothetical protein